MRFVNIPIIDVNEESFVNNESKEQVSKMIVLRAPEQKSHLENTITRLKNAIHKSDNTLPDVLSRKILLLCNTGSAPSKFELKITPEMLAEMEKFYSKEQEQR